MKFCKVNVEYSAKITIKKEATKSKDKEDE